MWGSQVSDDGEYLLITTSESTARVNRLFFAKLSELKKDEKGLAIVTKLIDNFEAEYDYITNEGTKFYFKTNLNAPRNKVIIIDFANPEKENWKEIIPQSPTDVLESVICVNKHYLVLEYMHNVQSVLKMFDLEGTFVKDLPLPNNGSLLSITGRKEGSLSSF